VTYYTRLDAGAVGARDGYISALFAPGTGIAGTVYFGLYAAVPGSAGESNGTLYQLGGPANQGGASAGVIREQLYEVGSSSTALSNLGFPATGNPIGGMSSGVLYGAVLVKTDAGTDHI
jgi:hypothetical protein